MNGTVRFCAALTPQGPGPAVPGIDRAALRLAMLEDVCDMLAALPLVRSALVVSPADRPAGADQLVAPGTPVLGVPAGPTGEVACAAFHALAGLGAGQAALVAGDAPDLPPLLVGKVFRGLGSADVAVVPADAGGLVALGAGLPLPPWLREVDCGLETEEAVQVLRAAAPRRRAVSVAPGWHRVRDATDIGYLDQDLEGWDVTRLLLSAGSA